MISLAFGMIKLENGKGDEETPLAKVEMLSMNFRKQPRK